MIQMQCPLAFESANWRVLNNLPDPGMVHDTNQSLPRMRSHSLELMHVHQDRFLKMSAKVVCGLCVLCVAC